MKRLRNGNKSATRHGELRFERLERRDLLAFDLAPNLFTPGTPQEAAIADEVGTDLAWLYSDFDDWEAAGGAEVGKKGGQERGHSTFSKK